MGLHVHHTSPRACAALAPILVQLSKDSQGAYSYNPVTVNLLTEIAKTTFAFGVLLFKVRFATDLLKQQRRGMDVVTQ